MRFFYLSLLLTALSVVACFAQSNFQPGYVVKLSGDTVRGYVDYRGWDNNPKRINFKRAIADATPDHYSVTNAVSFNVEGIATYEKYIGKITTDEVNEGHLNEGRDSSTRLDTVFLRVLIRGDRLKLYTYSDNIKTRYFIEETADHKVKELLYKLYFDLGAVTSAKGRTVTENTFQKQLFALAVKYNLDDKPQIIRDIETAGYYADDLEKIVSELNTSNDAGLNAKSKNTGSAFHFFAGVAANITAISSSSGSTYLAAGGKNSTSVLPQISFGFNVYPEPIRKKVAFRLDVAISESSYTADYTTVFSPYDPFHYSFNQYSVSLHPQIIFNFYNTDNLKIFIGAGASVSLYSYSNESFKDVKNPAYDLAEIPFALVSGSVNGLAKIGVLINNKIEIYGAYLTRDGLTTENYFELNEQQTHVGINYLFK